MGQFLISVKNFTIIFKMSWFFLWILCFFFFFFFFFAILQIGFQIFSLSFNREKRSLFLMCESNYFHLWKKLFIRKFDSIIPIGTISNFREESHFQDVLIRIILSMDILFLLLLLHRVQQIGFQVFYSFSLSFNREKRFLFFTCESNYFRKHLWKKLFIRKFDSMIPIRTISNFREEPHRHFQDVLIRIIFSILCFFFLFFTVLLCFFFFFFTVLQIGVFSSFNSEKRFLFLTCESNYFRKHLWKKLFIRKFNDRDNFQFPLIWRNNISKLYTFSRIRPVADASRESLTTPEANGKKKKERGREEALFLDRSWAIVYANT